jgi:hypothetical protein
MNWFAWCSALALLITTSAALADDADVPPTVSLKVTAAAEPSPALKYKLLPGPLERKPGNAATFYYRAIVLHLQNSNRADLDRQYSEHVEAWEGEWQGAPPESLRRWLEFHPPSMFGEIRTATHRERCDFDFRVQDIHGPELISFLLPEVQEMRTLGRLLKFKARLALADGNFEEAAELLKQGYQLGCDTASEPLLINGLVGIAVCSLMNAEVERWIGTADSPNLYWALSSLPSPLIDLRPALVQETGFPVRYFPFLEDPEHAQHTPEQWQRMLSDAVRQITNDFPSPQIRPQNPLAALQSELTSAFVLARAYPQAKAGLLKAGYTAEQLEKMPVGQVIAIEMKRVTRYMADEFAKGAQLPQKQRERFYTEVVDRLKRERYLGASDTREPLPLASLLMPAVEAAFRAQSRLDRDLAALRTLEAIRLHLAAKGELPEKLSDITAVPLPNNPFTDEPFPYHREGNRATLEVPQPPGMPPQIGKRYVLTIAR